MKIYLTLILLFATPLLAIHKLYGQDSVQYMLAGKLLDVRTGQLDTNVLLTIEGNQIAEISYSPDVSNIENYIDLRQYTVLPGLIDCHTHLVGDWYRGEDEFDVYTLPAASYGILGTVNAKKTLEAGFTTVRDVHSYFYGDVALRDAINKHWIPGPRMYVSGPALSITGGHGAFGNWLSPQIQFAGNLVSIADGEDEVRKETRNHLKYQVDWIKIFATGGFGSYGTIPGAASYTIEEIAAAVDEARKRGIQVCAHAHGAEGIKNALKAGVRSIEHGTFLDDECIELLKEKEAFLVMDLKAAFFDLIETNQDYSGKLNATDSNQQIYADLIERFKKAYDAGVKMAFGSDAGVYPHGKNAEQFVLMKDAGMREIDIIRSATLNAAELLAISDKLGVLEENKLADIIAVKGNPLENIRVLEEVVFVMKDGSIYKSNK